MKRPWQFWVLFALCVMVMLAAMSWLTHKTLVLDRAEAQARRQAELEEDISRALWLMDVRLVPLLAREAARPHFIYRPYFVPGGRDPDTPGLLEPSPLLLRRPDFVRLNFQLEPQDRWTSPQIPTGEHQQTTLELGISAQAIEQARSRLAELQQQVRYDRLLSNLPTDVTGPVTRPLPRTPETVSSKLGKVFNNLDLDALQRLQSRDQPRQSEAASSSPGLQQSAQRVLPDRRTAQTQLDLQNRDAAVQAYAKSEFARERLGWSDSSQDSAREGVSQPVWIGSQLLLARRVELEGQLLIQGCWLDWPQIKQMLLNEIVGLLPDADLQPVGDTPQLELSRMLATLPVQLMVADAPSAPTGWSALRISLLTAWVCVVLAVTAVGALSFGALALSERRGAFVSAVTHELRTPLTTFRMYSEMLAQDMVPDRRKQRQYLDTLRIEADRLSHLVENVLAYARLEKTRPRRQRETIRIPELMERLVGRLSERAEQAEMELVPELDPAAQNLDIETDPSAVEQILFNLVDNACKYAQNASDRRLHVRVGVRDRFCCIRVCDHGSGIAGQDQRRLFQPFSKSATQAAHTAPGIGLGLALCQRLARQLGGRLSFEQNSGDGAVFVLVLPL